LATQAPPALQLLVIDATWRKSRKMLALNPLLAALPRLALPPQALNRYAALRKAQRPGQLSTLEATALALGLLETMPERYSPLLAAFESFVAAQALWCD
jgi:DTW domain-containing protein YfiP